MFFSFFLYVKSYFLRGYPIPSNHCDFCLVKIVNVYPETNCKPCPLGVSPLRQPSTYLQPIPHCILHTPMPCEHMYFSLLEGLDVYAQMCFLQFGRLAVSLTLYGFKQKALALKSYLIIEVNTRSELLDAFLKINSKLFENMFCLSAII